MQSIVKCFTDPLYKVYQTVAAGAEGISLSSL